jgi:hypothetical protein
MFENFIQINFKYQTTRLRSSGNTKQDNWQQPTNQPKNPPVTLKTSYQPRHISFWFCLLVFLLLFSWVWAHCSINKGSYNVSNISYLNSLLHSSPSSILPYSWKSFNRYHFCIYIHVYITTEFQDRNKEQGRARQDALCVQS